MEIEHIDSPNRFERRGTSVVAVVLHYDASPSDRAAVGWLCNPASSVSAHYHVGRDGRIVQMVPLDMAAWHAGPSEIPVPFGDPVARGANMSTIGIEIGNLGLLLEEQGKFFWGEQEDRHPYKGAPPVHAALEYLEGTRIAGWWEPFTDVQLEALASVLQGIMAAGYSAAVKNLVGHDEIARPWGRKQDPGPLFPWERFHREVTRPLKSILL